jgi:hypothetical protein
MGKEGAHMRDTIDMAREAGIIDFRDAFSEEHVQAVLQDLKAFEALVRADEREACAKVCEDVNWEGSWKKAANDRASAIRARGNT